jgi:hypothetical protein
MQAICSKHEHHARLPLTTITRSIVGGTREGSMIKYVTWPGNINQWNHEEDHLFYLEVFGEARPKVSPEYTQLPLPGEGADLNQSKNCTPLYEYYWSLGYVDLDGKCGPSSWGGELADTAAEVYLYFPTAGGWQIEELLATIKYLCPAREHVSLLQDAAHMFAAAQPIVEDASKLAAIGLPGVGSIAASTATLLDVIARLKVTSVPPMSGYEWSVQKVAQHAQGEGLLHGIKWTISKKLFMEFGSRLTGSIAVNIIPSMPQARSGESDHMERLPLRARAVMNLHPQRFQADEPVSLPENGFLELQIEPVYGADAP